MLTLRALLDGYRNHGKFPSYAQLQALSVELPALSSLLSSYQEGASLPSYAALATIAYA